MGRQDAARQIQLDPTSDAATDLESFVGYNMKRAYMILQNDFRDALGQDGLSPRAFSALSLVVRCPNITQSELARRLGIERSGLVSIVDELEQRAYLARTTVPGDRRVQALVPTPGGIACYKDALAAVRRHEDTLLSDMTHGEKQMLIDLLKKIRAVEDTA